VVLAGGQAGAPRPDQRAGRTRRRLAPRRGRPGVPIRPDAGVRAGPRSWHSSAAVPCPDRDRPDHGRPAHGRQVHGRQVRRRHARGRLAGLRGRLAGRPGRRRRATAAARRGVQQWTGTVAQADGDSTTPSRTVRNSPPASAGAWRRSPRWWAVLRHLAARTGPSARCARRALEGREGDPSAGLSGGPGHRGGCRPRGLGRGPGPPCAPHFCRLPHRAHGRRGFATWRCGAITPGSRVAVAMRGWLPCQGPAARTGRPAGDAAGPYRRSRRRAEAGCSWSSGRDAPQPRKRRLLLQRCAAPGVNWSGDGPAGQGRQTLCAARFAFAYACAVDVPGMCARPHEDHRFGTRCRFSVHRRWRPRSAVLLADRRIPRRWGRRHVRRHVRSVAATMSAVSHRKARRPEATGGAAQATGGASAVAVP